MSRRPHPAHRLAVLLGTAVLLAAIVVLLGGHVGLELAPAILLLSFVGVGWLPGERQLAWVLARRADRRRITAGPAPLVRLRAPRVHGDGGRARSGTRSSRGPPALCVA